MLSQLAFSRYEPYACTVIGISIKYAVDAVEVLW